MPALSVYSRVSFRSSMIATVALALTCSLPVADAEAWSRKRSYERDSEEIAKPAPLPESVEGPLTLMISLNQQRMFVYDARGYVTQTRISSGTTGYTTPKGIYSILEKNRDHVSNIYDAEMPFMQRLLWTGIAMHAGVVPNYPASHGCVRMPYDFAKKLFDITELNHRVIISPDVMAPVPIEHPNLFKALPPGEGLLSDDVAGHAKEASAKPSDFGRLIGVATAEASISTSDRTLASVAEERRQQRQRLVDAIDVAADARLAADLVVKTTTKDAVDAQTAWKKAQYELEKVLRNTRSATRSKESAVADLKSIDWQIARAERRGQTKKAASLSARIPAIEARIAALSVETAPAEQQISAAKSAVDKLKIAADVALAAKKKAVIDAKAAGAAETNAAKAPDLFDKEEERRKWSISVFVSAKTGKIMVRQGFQPVMELPVTIERPDQPLGTFIYTATDWRDNTQTSLNWTAVNVDENYVQDGADPKRRANVVPTPQSTNDIAAAAALERIKFPDEALKRIAEVMKPGSSLIISDYDIARSESGAGTEFIVQMPEVVAKVSRPKPRRALVRYIDQYGNTFYGEPPRNLPRKKPSFFFNW